MNSFAFDALTQNWEESRVVSTQLQTGWLVDGLLRTFLSSWGELELVYFRLVSKMGAALIDGMV